MTLPLFIPKEDIIPGAVYTGYVATPKGLVHHTHAATRGHLTTGPVKWNGMTYKGKPLVSIGILPESFEVALVKRRTPAQRTASLAARLADHFERNGVSASLVGELQAVAWKAGNPITSEECRRIAAAKLSEAEKTREEEERHQVTRRSPYVLDRPSQARISPEPSSVSRKGR